MGRADDSFAQASDAYARSRPHYPASLFDWIASRCRAHDAAWDCATGNGQAALGLAAHFALVEATDLSAEQIGQGFDAPNIVYSARPAERSDFEDARFDCVAVAQALHWFDFARFWPEVRRVARPGAFFCAWGYSWFRSDPELHALYMDPLRALLAPFWAPNNGMLWRGYPSEEIRFPFERVEAPAFSIRLHWDIEEVVGYVRTWSACKLACAEPAAAAAIVEIEETVLARFAPLGPIALDMPLSIAAGPIA